MVNAAIATLNNGIRMPLLGLGCWDMWDAAAQQTVETAIATGYRLIDTAAMYRNETEVGAGIAASGIPRDQLFVTTKVGNPDQGYDSTLRAYEASCKRLGLGYVDLYLVHWPVKGQRCDTWRALEQLYAGGAVRAIGVCNYLPPFLKEMEEYAGVTRAVDQCEFTSYLFQRDLLAAGAEDPTVRALIDATNKNTADVPLLRYTHAALEVDATATRLGRNFTTMSDRGVSVARFCQRLRAEGYVPDVIYGHSGWGETLFLKEVWPEAKLLVFAEFYYRGRAADTGFDPEFQVSGFDQVMIAQSRAAYMAQALAHADLGVSPTEWQASTHPPLLRQQLEVIFDGVDCDRLAPNPDATFSLPDGRILKRGDEVLTFVNRNLEPYRGYHIFMRALPDVLAARPEAQVVIVGGDEVSYGAKPKDGASWKEVILAEVKDRLDLSRVHFVGKLPYDRLVDLIHVSRVHAYLSYPFVLSWSMVETMSGAATVQRRDTALILVVLALVRALAATPGRERTARTEVVKVIIDTRNDWRVYFLQSRRWEIHYFFARRFLEFPGQPIESHEAFTRAFVDRFGLAPSEYRARHGAPRR